MYNSQEGVAFLAVQVKSFFIVVARLEAALVREGECAKRMRVLLRAHLTPLVQSGDPRENTFLFITHSCLARAGPRVVIVPCSVVSCCACV